MSGAGGDDPAGWVVVWNLPSLADYADRLQMLGHLSQRVHRLYVLTSAVDAVGAAAMARWPRLRLVGLGRARFRPRAHAWLDARRERLAVVHDTFGHLVDWMAARQGARSVRYVSTQYTSNVQWLEGVRRAPGSGFDAHYAALRAVTFWRDRRVAAAVDRVLVLGPGHDADFARRHPGIAAARVKVVPSEVDVERFRPAPRRVEGAPLVLFTGRLLRSKGVGLLLEVMGALRRGPCPSARLALVGPVPAMERGWLEAQVAASGLEEGLSVVPEVPQAALVEWYQRADVFAFPSRYEGSPRSVREALACGCRAVLSDIPGHRGIDPGGDFAWFVEGEGPAAWQAALQAALEEAPAAAAARSAAGVARMQQVHGLAAVAEALVAEYRALRATPARGEGAADPLRGGGGCGPAGRRGAGPGGG